MCFPTEWGRGWGWDIVPAGDLRLAMEDWAERKWGKK